jgi:hypothetical protein
LTSALLSAWVVATALWQPPGIASAQIPASAMIAAIRNAQAGAPNAYLETLHVTGSDGSFDAMAHVIGEDYKVEVVLDGVTYAYGRTMERSWRETPNGVVRIVASDVQSDPLDRWPRSRFGFSPRGCTSAGTTSADQKTLWVLQCRAPGDISHWYDIDPASGRIVHEIARDGAHVFVYDFSDERRWTIHGYGGDADVAVTSLIPENAAAAGVAIPPTLRSVFDLPPSGVAEIPASFHYHIDVPVEIDGVRRTFILDTGTTQILIDVGEAARLGLHPKFGHVMIPTLQVGDVVAHNVAAQAVDQFHDRIGAGILGNEFFIGHVVHIDYRRQQVELIAHDDFKPPPGAHTLAFDPREGMPIVQASANGVSGARFALDTGSYWVLLLSPFGQLSGADKDSTVGVQGDTLQFLEGPMSAQLRELTSFAMGSYRFPNVDADVEFQQSDNLDIPLDGIIGVNVLSTFEWWYDYDDGIAWLR